MKNKTYKAGFVIACAFFALLSISCDKNSSINTWIGSADLIITNLTTGDSRHNTKEYLIDGEINHIVFRHGDNLQLKFTPPDDYKKKKFTVRYKLFDLDIEVHQSPYIYELIIPEYIPIGSYLVVCSAMCEDWDDQSSCTQAISFRVEK